MFRFIALALFVISAAIMCCLATPASAAPIPKHLMKNETEAERIKGVWELSGFRIKGMEIARPGNNAQLNTYEFTANSLTIKSGGRETAYKIKFDEVDGLKRFTAEADANGLVGNNANMQYGYKIHDDKLILALEAGPQRAAGNPDNPGPNTFIMILTRMPDKK